MQKYERFIIIFEPTWLVRYLPWGLTLIENNNE